MFYGRLCFQCYLVDIPGRKEPIPLAPKVSDVIRDKKAYNDLTLVDYSDHWSPLPGGKKILVFTKKISKHDIEVHFLYIEPKSYTITLMKHGWKTNDHLIGNKRLVMRGSFTPYDVHEQYAISLSTPPFVDQNIKRRVRVKTIWIDYIEGNMVNIDSIWQYRYVIS